jgi:2-polyprenyl-3-methyl-5-hydroxy-6-metoxy-1,4-benzoquinol methylase
MENTGERHILSSEIKNEAEYYNHLMHIATYKYALKFANDKQVLDYGCGSAYGSYMLSEVADRVTAVDINEEILLYARKTYRTENLIFKHISGLTNEKFDLITVFQVIEHVNNARSLISKLRSLLKPDGMMLISTPNKKNRLYNFIQRPWNIFHHREFSGPGLKYLLQDFFKNVEVLNIGSDSDLVLKEIARTRKQRLITLPCTLIIYPDLLRIRLLGMQINASRMIRKIKASIRSQMKDSDHNLHFKNTYSTDDIIISGRIKYSTDLFAICSL